MEKCKHKTLVKPQCDLTQVKTPFLLFEVGNSERRLFLTSGSQIAFKKNDFFLGYVWLG